MKTFLMLCTLFLLLVGCAGGPRSLEFVDIKGGCYQMGDTFGGGEPDEKPVHEVCVSDFSMARYEVTLHQWETVMGKQPASANPCGPDCPVDAVSWNMAQEFVGKMNSGSGKQYRLPTEAEWEYAARSGGKDEQWSGTSAEDGLGEFAWYLKNSGNQQHTTGQKKPNGLGLHDMSGNVAEWCQDWYGADYYAISPKDNPVGPAAGEKRVVRGGGPYDSRDVRTPERHSDAPDIVDGDYGFRLVRPVK